jgi:hypothetical protein
MASHVISEPWDALLGNQTELSDATTVNGVGSVRLTTPFSDNDKQNPKVSTPSGNITLPAAGFPFIHNDNLYQHWHLPTCAVSVTGDSGCTSDIIIEGRSHVLTQTGVISRPTVEEQSSGEISAGIRLSGWIDWQIRNFQELHRLKSNPDPRFDSPTFQNLNRRTWEAASKVWLDSDTEKARMALIVGLSEDDSLRRAMESISSRPRKILERIRRETHVSRIQELDPACIRDYARRPGVSAIEKAGARQTLMAVVRRERKNTLENRVATWVMEACNRLSIKYSLENAAFPNDEKIASVARFGRRNIVWKSSEELREVAPISELISNPNYPLQFDARYKLVWDTYLRILREKSVEDNAWLWQRCMWGETARQLLACCLHKIFAPKAVSTPYYRGSIRMGHWTEPPVSPGPFEGGEWGTGWLIDSRDLESRRKLWVNNNLFPGQKHIGLSGCDQCLFWHKSKTLILIWHLYHCDLDESGEELKEILKRCGTALQELQQTIGGEINISGIMLTADLNRVQDEEARKTNNPVVLEMEPVGDSGAFVYALTLPPDVDAWGKFSEDFEAGIRLVIEEVLVRDNQP